MSDFEKWFKSKYDFDPPEEITGIRCASREAWNFQQEKIDALEKKLADAREFLGWIDRHEDADMELKYSTDCGLADNWMETVGRAREALKRLEEK